jgi:hypothetical protein
MKAIKPKQGMREARTIDGVVFIAAMLAKGI